MKTINENFNCLEMKKSIQAQVYTETKDMSFDELRNYFNSHLKDNSFWKKINAKRA